jgi:hypothetical protein
MPTLTINYDTDAERLLLEQAIAFVTSLHGIAQAAPVGSVLDACEKAALGQGKQFLRTTLAGAVQSRIDTLEEKGAVPAPVRGVPVPDGTRGGTNEPC